MPGRGSAGTARYVCLKCGAVITGITETRKHCVLTHDPSSVYCKVCFYAVKYGGSIPRHAAKWHPELQYNALDSSYSTRAGHTGPVPQVVPPFSARGQDGPVSFMPAPPGYTGAMFPPHQALDGVPAVVPVGGAAGGTQPQGLPPDHQEPLGHQPIPGPSTLAQPPASTDEPTAAVYNVPAHHHRPPVSHFSPGPCHRPAAPLAAHGLRAAGQQFATLESASKPLQTARLKSSMPAVSARPPTPPPTLVLAGPPRQTRPISPPVGRSATPPFGMAAQPPAGQRVQSPAAHPGHPSAGHIGHQSAGLRLQSPTAHLTHPSAGHLGHPPAGRFPHLHSTSPPSYQTAQVGVPESTCGMLAGAVSAEEAADVTMGQPLGASIDEDVLRTLQSSLQQALDGHRSIVNQHQEMIDAEELKIHGILQAMDAAAALHFSHPPASPSQPDADA